MKKGRIGTFIFILCIWLVILANHLPTFSDHWRDEFERGLSMGFVWIAGPAVLYFLGIYLPSRSGDQKKDKKKKKGVRGGRNEKKKGRRNICRFILCLWILMLVLNILNLWELDEFVKGLVEAWLFLGGAAFLYYFCIYLPSHSEDQGKDKEK